MNQNKVTQLLTDRLNELRFPEGLFPSEDMTQLKAIVEDERAALEAEFDAKLRARVIQKITRKTIGKIISGGAAVATTGGAL